MSKPLGVTFIATCPNCGTEVQVVVTKKELKAVMKGFKLPLDKAQLYAEKRVKGK